MSDTERIRELLNYSGYPFQHYCADKLAKIDGFQVSAEVPFTHPETNGPLLGIHGAIDVLAVRPNSTAYVLLCFVVECKKANDKIKNWILLPNIQQNPRWPTFFFSRHSLGQPFQFAVSRSVTFPRLGYSNTGDYDYCINGIEANTALSATNQDQREKVYNPLKQVAHGARALEASALKVVDGIDYFRNNQFSMTLYIPVVITTANIFTADIPVDQITQGEVPPSGLALSAPRKWVTVEFALPDYLGYTIARPEGKVAVTKRTVFIVNDKSIDEFFGSALEVTNIEAVPGK